MRGFPAEIRDAIVEMDRNLFRMQYIILGGSRARFTWLVLHVTLLRLKPR